MKFDRNIPEAIQEKLQDCLTEVDSIIDEAESLQSPEIKSRLKINYKHSAPTTLLSPLERAQSIHFITRYENLPVLNPNGIKVIEEKGKYYFQNVAVAFFRHILNEYRSIIQNKKDSVNFKKIHKFCLLKLSNRDPKLGLSITVRDEDKNEITDIFVLIIGEKIKSIKCVLGRSDFDYLYNGILQHSEPRHTQKFLNDYQTGQLNYVFLKHAALLSYIKDCLFFHYKILNALTFPKLGPL